MKTHPCLGRFSLSRRSNPAPLLLASALLGAVLANASRAQSTAESASREEPVVISPFEVSVQRDNGFVAANSLAGGRLASDLANTPVAYSVLTKDFIDALQLTDLNQMSQWFPSASSTADNGNAASFGTNDEVRLSTFRGAVTNAPQRNFFPFAFNFDGYNLERLDLARGANAILFGNGGFGGSPNSVTKRALPGDNASTETRFSYGYWENRRATFDVNVPLAKNAAVRANVLWSDRDGWRDHDFEKKEAATLAATWMPTPGTEIRAEAEYGMRDAAVVVTRIADRFSGWDGVTTYNARLASLPANANAIGIGRAPNSYVIYNQAFGPDTMINYGQMAFTQAGNQVAGVPVNGQMVVGASANILSQSMLFTNGLPADRFSKAIAGSNFEVPDRTFSTSPDVPLRRDRYRTFTLGLTQKLGENFYADLAANYFRFQFQGDYLGNRNINDTWIDINRNLPTGAINPNFLQPYNEGPTEISQVTTTAMNVRGALAYVLDTSWAKFKFNLLGGTSRQEAENRFSNYALAVDPDPRNWSTANLVRFRYYWSDTSRPLPLRSTWNYIDPLTNSSRQVPADYYLSTASNGHQNFDYGVASATATFWHDRINLIGAMRRDYYYADNPTSLNLKDNPADWDSRTPSYKPAAPSDYYTLTYVPKNTSGQPTGSALPALARPRDASGFRLAQYANDRFQDDYSPLAVKGYATTLTSGAVWHATSWASAFVNYGESYDLPPSLSIDVNGGLFPATTSRSLDYGLRFSVLGGRVVANLIGYQGRSTQLQSTGMDKDFDSLTEANPIGNTSERNRRGLVRVPARFSDSLKNEYTGYEVEVVANLTPSWRLLLNGALPRAEVTDKFPNTRAYLTANDATLRQVLADTGVLVNSANVASVDPTVPGNQLSSDAATAATGWNNIQAALGSITNGNQPAQRLTKFTANIFTDYRFREGFLKNFRIGAGMNYRGQQIIGFRGGDTIRNPANPGAAIDNPAVNALTPVYQDRYYTAVMTLGYKFKLKARYTVSLDLKIDNLFDWDRPIYYDTVLRPENGDLSNPARVSVPNNFGYLTPRNCTFSTTVRF